jgi:hypothetical protein
MSPSARERLRDHLDLSIPRAGSKKPGFSS